MTPRVSQIAAIDRNRGLGKDNDLLYKIPGDLKRFRMMTKGHAVVMGRKTFDSIVAVRGSALPDRPNIVITRNPEWKYGGEGDVRRAPSLDEALEVARAIEPEEVFIVGGADIYAQALPKTDRLYLTLVDAEEPADVYFPDYAEFGKVILDEAHEEDGVSYRYLTLER